MILLLAETGFRIGEMLGVYYTKDINYQKHSVRVSFREGNENDARAKNAEYREAVISPETFRILMLYLSENRELLKKTEHLFINLSGPNAGKPLNANAVYAMMGRLETKTKIKVTPAHAPALLCKTEARQWMGYLFTLQPSGIGMWIPPDSTG